MKTLRTVRDGPYEYVLVSDPDAPQQFRIEARGPRDASVIWQGFSVEDAWESWFDNIECD